MVKLNLRDLIRKPAMAAAKQPPDPPSQQPSTMKDRIDSSPRKSPTHQYQHMAPSPQPESINQYPCIDPSLQQHSVPQYRYPNSTPQQEPIRQYQHAPFCCTNLTNFMRSNVDAEGHDLIDHFVGIMKHNPNGFFAHDSHWCPTISVNDITSVITGPTAFKNLISLERCFVDMNFQQPTLQNIQHSRPTDKFFVPTWGTTYCNSGAYLEVDLQNGNWTSVDVIRQALSPYYNDERQIYEQYSCSAHPGMMYRVWLWEISTAKVSEVQISMAGGGRTVFPAGYRFPYGSTEEEILMAHRFGITVELWRRWRDGNRGNGHGKGKAKSVYSSGYKQW
ncbi:hypothetical protein GLAREA_06357 [Glarea lozoyensis ATCC 20868]|uniref:Uncharacterized protein n=1 Tax=Glarea lozoyensis (strain ATCC 20868 / MF5171) TaxID=1116229 RepID=S3D6I2_GLAL2|nr:uncharacterized protein GLAREA_06357 [Glarea lozoyensis ATCC 20868]EPE33345.1 hypothetical protein GLAREA_06357 [Glarea lozoyensis ATCC 20868]